MKIRSTGNSTYKRLHSRTNNKVYGRYFSRDIKIFSETEGNQEIKERNKEDSDVRREIFKLIFEYVYCGKSTLELMEKLNSNDKYKKYANFFASWIDMTIIKKKKIVTIVEKEKKQGKTDKEILKQLLGIAKYNSMIATYLPSIISLVKEEKGIEYE